MSWVLPVAISLICSILASCNIVLCNVPLDSSFHFNLITVNALFGGFLYTNYSLLIGLVDKEIIREVQNTDIIPKRNSHILKGIIYSVISVFSGLCLVFLSDSNLVGKVWKLIEVIAINTEGVFMVFCILYFALSLNEMYRLVNNINKSPDKKSKEKIGELREKIKRHHTK